MNTPNNINSNSDDDEDEQVYSNAVVQRLAQDRRDSIIPTELQLETHYDRSLTAANQYLRNRLHEASGRRVYEKGAVYLLQIIFIKQNLVPGQILPIIARSSDVKLILKYAVFLDHPFGVCYKLNENKRTFGTIAKIYEYSVEMETSQSFQIKAMGLQRFEIIRVRHFPERHGLSYALAEIKIIPDIILTNPYNTLCLHPKKRYTSHGEMCRKRDMWQTQWPDWVYKQFDVYELAFRLSKKVKLLYKDVKISDDPRLLSFQVISLGIFSQEQVSELLGIESTNLRLQYELQYWNRAQSLQKFLCARSGCSAPVCNMSNVFPMSPEGPQGTYCNSCGIIHEMITVTELEDDLDVISGGKPSTECCWYPGYKGTIILCPNCQSHVGWSYLADENLTQTPRLFYGLSVLAITSIKDYLVPHRERLEEINDGEMMSAPSAADPMASPPAPAASTQALAQTETNPAQPASRRIGLSIPLMRGQLLVDFGRMDSTYRRHDLVVNVDALVSVAQATYQQLEQLSAIALPMDELSFVRMWRTLILKRVQDIFELEKQRRAEHFIHVMPNLLVPAPLADLLYSLGQLHSRALGTVFDMIPPARPAVPQPWWTLDNQILDQWCLLTARMSTLYVMKKSPAKNEFKDRAIGMTSIQDHDNIRSVKSLTNEPTASDGFIRFVNDELFTNPFPFVNSDFRIVEGLERELILGSYAVAYVTGTNS